MSTIAIAFTAIGTGSGGQVQVGFNDNSIGHTLTLVSKNGASIAGYFSQIPTDLPTDPDTAQAQAYAQSFNRDFKNLGGNNNLSATISGNVVTITANIGTFTTFAQTGNFATNNGINNTAQTLPLVFSTARASTGDCLNIDYAAAASEGLPPYTLKQGNATLNSGWNGSNFGFSLKRGRVEALSLTDSNGTVINRSLIVPRKLAEGDFSVSSANYETYSDILIKRDVEIAGTTPLSYSLEPLSATTGANYQSSNAFSGVLEGQYKIFIKDKYGCEISKTINITGFQDATENENPRYFDVMEGQSFIVSEFPEFDHLTKKNYFNTGSYNQDDLVTYRASHYIDVNDTSKGVQFKSSYDWHIITLHGCNGSKIDVPSIMIQENLGIKEKMDCHFFAVGSKTGVYFQGGNTYVPDTTTLLGTNVFFGTTPRWANVGQLVFFDGLGGFYIESNGFDSDRGGYFVVDMALPSTLESKVQLTYNRHDYNLFEFYLSPSDIADKSFFIIEKGFNGSGVVVGNPWVSEIIEKRSDTSNLLLLDWSDTLNKGDIVFQSGIKFFARVEGEFNPIWDNVAETESGDSRENSIQQKTFLGFEVSIEAINQKQITQLNVASALEGFKVNNLSLVRKKPPEIKPLGKSNKYSWKCEFGYGDNKIAIKQDEIVLSVSTGVVGGGGTGKSGVPNLSGITLYKDPDGNLINISGNLMKQ